MVSGIGLPIDVSRKLNSIPRPEKLIVSDHLWWKYLHKRNNEMLQIKAFICLLFYIDLLNIHQHTNGFIHYQNLKYMS